MADAGRFSFLFNEFHALMVQWGKRKKAKMKERRERPS